jgi:hypothetical protein
MRLHFMNRTRELAKLTRVLGSPDRKPLRILGGFFCDKQPPGFPISLRLAALRQAGWQDLND